MSSRDSGCAIFCCFRRPKTYSPAKKALDEDPPLNFKDIESTHGANNLETEANNLTLDENKQFPERNADSVQGATDGNASSEAQQKRERTNEVITEAPSSQHEPPPPPPECIDSVKLRSSLGVENAGGGEGGVGNGELGVGGVKATVCEAQLDADEEELARHVASLEQLVERLEAVADALEATPGSTELNDAIVSGISIERTELFSSGDAGSGDGSSPSCVLDGSEWTVANHRDNQELLVHMTDAHQNVSIRNCNGCTIQIDGKPDSISIDDCVKCGVVFRDVATSVNISNCQRLQIQGLGIVPCIYAKNTDGLSIYVSRECSEVPVFSFKCSELNLLVPSDGGDGDFMEVSVPEQFRSHWNGDCWRTDVADIVA